MKRRVLVAEWWEVWGPDPLNDGQMLRHNSSLYGQPPAHWAQPTGTSNTREQALRYLRDFDRTVVKLRHVRRYRVVRAQKGGG